MPISDTHGYDAGHFGRVYEHLLKPAIQAAGYTPIRADDTSKTDYIVVGIIQNIIESEMILCDLTARNPNVMYELGICHAFNKQVVLIKDKKTDKIFDIQGLRYTEYDESLRIDSVQKDKDRIKDSVIETKFASQDSINSVVQLAGIKPAKMPKQQTISPDTQLLLSAIGSIEKRIQYIESMQINKYFSFIDGGVEFEDGYKAIIGETIMDENHQPIGELVGIHPGDGKIFIKRDDGKVIPFSPYSIKSKGLTTIPF